MKVPCPKSAQAARAIGMALDRSDTVWLLTLKARNISSCGGLQSVDLVR
jgi:hypothetical protein